MTERWKQDGKQVVVKTPEQWAAEAAGADGYECPRCGCKDWRGEQNSQVEVTRHPESTGATVRKRICRRCGQTRFATQEIVVPDGYKVKVVPDQNGST